MTPIPDIYSASDNAWESIAIAVLFTALPNGSRPAWLSWSCMEAMQPSTREVKMAKKLSKLTSAFISMAAATLLTPSLASAAIVTFQNLSVSGDVPIEQFEDGMRYALSRPFSVRDFQGNPPSALIGSPIFIDTPSDRPTVFTTASFRDFTFDGYDLASFGPPQQSDTWLFRGMLGSTEQFSFSDSTTGPFTDD